MIDSGNAEIALCNPKSPSNVGAVLRAAGCYGATAVYYNGKRFEHAEKYHQDTNRVKKEIQFQAVESFMEVLKENQTLVCVELVEGATSLPEFIHPKNALYIFGPEDGSIQQSLVSAADSVVYIPTIGCMNLAATVNVLLYDRMAKQQNTINHNERIKKSRDSNNHLKIKPKNSR